MIQTWTCPGCGALIEDECACAVEDIDFDELLCSTCQDKAEAIEDDVNDNAVFAMGVHRKEMTEDDCCEEEGEWMFTTAGEKLLREKMREAFPLYSPDNEESFGRACGLIYR